MQLFPPATLTVPPISFGDLAPDGLGILDEDGLAAWDQRSIAIGDVHAFQISDAVVHPPHGVITVGDYALDETLAHVPFHLPGYGKRDDAITIPLADARIGLSEAFHGFAGGFDNYYHWLIDIVSRLQLRPYGPIAYDGVLLLPPRETRFHDDLVDIFAGSRPTLTLTHAHAAAIGNLTWVPNLAGHGYAPNPQLRLVFDRLRQALGVRSRPKRRVYLSRRGAANRVLVNEDEVESMLQRYGFEVVELGRLSFPDQVRLFSEASHVVAPHGAGLANVVFCPAGAAVLELHMNVYLNWCFRRLGGVRNLRYGCLVGATDLSGGWNGWAHDKRWAAPLDRLRSALEDPRFTG